MPIRHRSMISPLVFTLLAACGGPQFVQPEIASAPLETVASVEAVKWSSGSPGAAVFSAGIVRIWDARGARLFDAAPAKPATRVNLKPGVYEFLLRCEGEGKEVSPPRLGMRLDANQRFSLHCEPGEGDKLRLVSTSLAGPAASSRP